VIVVDGQKYLHIHPNHRLSGNVAMRPGAAHPEARSSIRAWYLRYALGAMALIDKFGAKFVANPPCQPALARVIGREYNGEVRGNFEIFRNHLHAAGRDVRNCTVPW